jgi:hypothetical protein
MVPLAILPAHCHIGRQWLPVLPHLYPTLPNLTCSFDEKHLNRLSPNPFAIIKNLPMQPSHESYQNISNCCFPVQGSILQLFQTVLSQDNRLMHLLQQPSHPCFLSLFESTEIRLSHPSGKLHQGEFRLLQADYEYTSSTAQVQRIVTLFICMKLITRYVWNLGQISNPYNICPT